MIIENGYMSIIIFKSIFLIDTCSQNNLLDYFQDDLIRDYKLEESWNWGVFDPFELSLEINILRDTNRSDKIKSKFSKIFYVNLNVMS